MARFLVWSDLHCEFRPEEIPQVPESCMDVDAILIAGDTHSGGRHMDMMLLIWDQIRKPIYYVKGNHEFYGTVMSELEKEEARKLDLFQRAGAEIYNIERKSAVVAGTRILGAMLWTDMNLFPGMFKQTRDVLFDGMKDFSRIETAYGRSYTPEDWMDRHWADRDFLMGELKKPFDGPTVVMTHHLPIKQMINQTYRESRIGGQLVNSGYASDMWDEIKTLEIDTWICGHSHFCQEIDLRSDHGYIRFLANPHGYAHETTDFNPACILHTGVPEPDADLTQT